MSELGPPLDEALKALLQKEQARPGPGDETRSRIEARLGQSIVAGAGSSASPQSSGATPPSLKDVLTSKAGLVVLGTGLALGAGARHIMQPAPEVRVETVYVEKLVPAPPALTPEASTTQTPRAVAAEVSNPAVRRPPAQRAKEKDAGGSSSLLRENALIARAQSALARRDFDAAITALEEHARSFADGQLAEEREVMWIRALALRGDITAAKKRASEFRARFPDTLLSPEAELGGAP